MCDTAPFHGENRQRDCNSVVVDRMCYLPFPNSVLLMATGGGGGGGSGETEFYRVFVTGLSAQSNREVCFNSCGR